MTLALDKASLAELTPEEIRHRIRTGDYAGDSWGLAPRFAQTAMVALPSELALDFMIFAQRNPRPIPLLAVTDPGEPVLTTLAPGADLRTDIARYRVFEDGRCIEEPEDVRDRWTENTIGFVIGCTGSFEHYLEQAGIALRHLDENRLVPIYVTDRDCAPAGRLRGPLAVSMRAIRESDVARVVQLTSRFPAFHGAPIWIGDPDALGVNLDAPAFGEPLPVLSGEVPVFWACSVTPQLMAEASEVESMITNAPNHMLITDVPTGELAAIA